MGSVLAYVIACRVRAAIATVPDWAKDVHQLRGIVQAGGAWWISRVGIACQDSGTGHRWRSTFEMPPMRLAMSRVGTKPCVPKLKDVFASTRPQRTATRIVDRYLILNASPATVARRLRAVCPGLAEERCTTAWFDWAPTLRRVGPYAANVFARLPLYAWTTDGRLHPAEGVFPCRNGRADARDPRRSAP